MKFNIQYKITTIIALTVAIVLIGIYGFLNDRLQKERYQRIYRSLVSEAKLSKSYLENLNLAEDFDQYIDSLADQIADDLNVRVTIVDNKGRVIGDSEISADNLQKMENHLYRPEIQKALEEGFGESRRFSTTVQKDMLYVAYPFVRGDSLGVVRLSLPLSEIQKVSNDLKKILTAALLIAFFIANGIGLIASMLVVKPIKDVSSIIRAISQGNYQKRSDLSTNDEIAEMGNSINHMADQIQSKIREITDNKSRFEAVFLSMFDGVMVVNGQGQISLMNETLKTFFNGNESFIGKKTLELVRNIEIQNMVDHILEKKSSMEFKEISLVMEEERILQIHVTPLIKNNRRDGAVLVFHDITELRKLENVRKDFVANVSHEIRTPVTNIKGYAETLIDGALDDKENAQEFLQIILSDSDRLSQLVDDLLDLSKIESGKLKLNMEIFSLEDIVDRVVLGFKMQCAQKGLMIKKQIDKNISKIVADKDSIEQVILNLIDNAVKYNRPGGAIIVSLKQVDSCVNLSVEDTGIGIPSVDLSRIFERFYRVDKARSRQLGGTGLGLSISKHIIQAHNGDIVVKSELAKGTVFTISLPSSPNSSVI